MTVRPPRTRTRRQPPRRARRWADTRRPRPAESSIVTRRRSTQISVGLARLDREQPAVERVGRREVELTRQRQAGDARARLLLGHIERGISSAGTRWHVTTRRRWRCAKCDATVTDPASRSRSSSRVSGALADHPPVARGLEGPQVDDRRRRPGQLAAVEHEVGLARGSPRGRRQRRASAPPAWFALDWSTGQLTAVERRERRRERGHAQAEQSPAGRTRAGSAAAGFGQQRGDRPGQQRLERRARARRPARAAPRAPGRARKNMTAAGLSGRRPFSA